MSDLAALHAQARRLTLSIRGGLDRLEAFEAVCSARIHSSIKITCTQNYVYVAPCIRDADPV